MKNAATVMLLRDGAAGPEVYLLRRVAGMAFAAGMHVFPGGTVDPQDYLTPIPEPERWAHRLKSDPALAAALVSAAVRETFEETGALIGVAGAEPAGESWEAERLALLRHEATFAGVLTRHDATVAPDVLHAWSRWITPTGEPRRYDTRFFVTALPDETQPRHVGGEAQHAGWVRVADVADRPMLPPTRITLSELARYESVEQILAAASSRDLAPILPIRRGTRVELPDGRVI